MYRYAICNQNRQVINVIIWDGESRWSPPEGCYVVRSDSCDIGQIYDPTDETFSYPDDFLAL